MKQAYSLRTNKLWRAFYAVNQIFRVAMQEEWSIFLLIMNGHHLSLNRIKLICESFAGNRKVKFFGCTRNIQIPCHVAEYHFTFVGMNDIALVREFLQYSGPVTSAGGIKIIFVNEYSSNNYDQSRKH